MRVALYARVSDDKLTSDGDRRQDVGRQLAKLRPVAEVMFPGVEIVQFVDDGQSAFKDDYSSRPEFVRMLREIRARRVQRVYVESLDRWARRIEDGLKTLREASESGCTVTSAAEGECDITTPDGWFRCGIAFLMAEWASRIQASKVRSGMERRRNDARRVCHSCGVVHMGRHPDNCRCSKCQAKYIPPPKVSTPPMPPITNKQGFVPKVKL